MRTGFQGNHEELGEEAHRTRGLLQLRQRSGYQEQLSQIIKHGQTDQGKAVREAAELLKREEATHARLVEWRDEKDAELGLAESIYWDGKKVPEPTCPCATMEDKTQAIVAKSAEGMVKQQERMALTQEAAIKSTEKLAAAQASESSPEAIKNLARVAEESTTKSEAAKATTRRTWKQPTIMRP